MLQQITQIQLTQDEKNMYEMIRLCCLFRLLFDYLAADLDTHGET